jgi:2-dehydro-3-deoxyphosphogluconate aldolase/(4S)-4-hydroxy-2-oxoglutarate aldolase
MNSGGDPMTLTDLHHRVSEAAIVPILMAGDSDAAAAVAIADDLVAAGAAVIEVLFRNPHAPGVLADIKRRHPGLLLAAGTVLDAAGAAKAVAAGADLMISPGLSPALHAAAQGVSIPLVPGVNTASEVQHARELGYLVQKFYPAWDHGHQRLPEFNVIYSDVSFLVTGALGASSVTEYAHHPNIAALGGNWMVKSAAAAAAFADDVARFRAARARP